MGGERCSTLLLDELGVAGDRRFAFESPDAPPGKPLLGSVQRQSMLRFAAETDATGQVWVRTAEDALLPVTRDELLLRLAAAAPGAATLALRHREAPFTDVRPIALHAAATARAMRTGSGAEFDPRQLRSNLLLALDGDRPFAEDALAGRLLRIGADVTLRVLERIPRCRMITLAPDTGEADPTPLRQLAQARQGRAGVYARCLRTGLVREGDPVWLVEGDG